MTHLETLIKLKNYLNCPEGTVLTGYLSDILTANCCKSRDALELKGFGECIQKIKDIPGEVEKHYKEQKNGR